MNVSFDSESHAMRQEVVYSSALRSRPTTRAGSPSRSPSTRSLPALAWSPPEQSRPHRSSVELSPPPSTSVLARHESLLASGRDMLYTWFQHAARWSQLMMFNRLLQRCDSLVQRSVVTTLYNQFCKNNLPAFPSFHFRFMSTFDLPLGFWSFSPSSISCLSKV